MTEHETFDHWAIVELFGHQRMAGRVTEATVGGCQFVRVDVPPCGDIPAYTRLLGQGAIYAINPIDEQTARAVGRQLRVRPVSVFELPELAVRQPAQLIDPAADPDPDPDPDPDEIF